MSGQRWPCVVLGCKDVLPVAHLRLPVGRSRGRGGGARVCSLWLFLVLLGTAPCDDGSWTGRCRRCGVAIALLRRYRAWICVRCCSGKLLLLLLLLLLLRWVCWAVGLGCLVIATIFSTSAPMSSVMHLAWILDGRLSPQPLQASAWLHRTLCWWCGRAGAGVGAGGVFRGQRLHFASPPKRRHSDKEPKANVLTSWQLTKERGKQTGKKKGCVWRGSVSCNLFSLFLFLLLLCEAAWHSLLPVVLLEAKEACRFFCFSVLFVGLLGLGGNSKLLRCLSSNRSKRFFFFFLVFLLFAAFRFGACFVRHKQHKHKHKQQQASDGVATFRVCAQSAGEARGSRA